MDINLNKYVWLGRPAIGLTLLAVSAVAAPAVAAPKTYPVYPIDLIRVIDGDTIVATVSGDVRKIRLCGIDASERNTPMGPPATAALTELLVGSKLTVAVAGKDLYGRTVGSVFIENGSSRVSVQAAMTKVGLSYYYSASRCIDRQETIDADNYARANNLGMRGIPGYPPPWEQRMRKPKLPMLLSLG